MAKQAPPVAPPSSRLLDTRNLGAAAVCAAAGLGTVALVAPNAGANVYTYCRSVTKSNGCGYTGQQHKLSQNVASVSGAHSPCAEYYNSIGGDYQACTSQSHYINYRIAPDRRKSAFCHTAQYHAAYWYRCAAYWPNGQ